LTYLKLKNLQKALEAFEHSVAMQPTKSNQDSLQHVAAIFEEFGMPLKAAVYQDAADGKTNDFKVERELGDLCYRYQNYDWARIKYQGAARLTSDLRLSTDMKAKAALSAAKKGMRDLAKNELTKLNSEVADNASVHYGLGVLAYDEGKFEEAIISFNIALRLDPDYDEAQKALEAAKLKAEGGVKD
jgi:tetratricopeptide (TPR) repeat protein